LSGTLAGIPPNQGHGLGIMPTLLAEGLGLRVNLIGGHKFGNLREESFSSSLFGEIQLEAADNNAAEAFAQQISHESRANEATVFCDVTFGFIFHQLAKTTSFSWCI
jgi:hypothetical protein